MRIALILGYQKSVNSHTPSRLHTAERATGIEHTAIKEITGCARLQLQHG